MTIPVVKPNVISVWADTGTVTAPSGAKVSLGWVAEIPTFQNTNWILNRQDAFNSHVNGWGIAQWDTTTNYTIGSWARSTVDAEVYVSLVEPNLANEPSATPLSWEILSVNLTGGLGTAAVEDVGVAVGNVLQYALDGSGTFGLGATVPVVFAGDVDTLVTTGFTAVDVAATNRPPGSTSGGLVVQSLNATDSTQVWAETGSDAVFVRRRNSGAYSPWVSVLVSATPLGTAAFVNTGVTAPDVPTVANLPTVLGTAAFEDTGITAGDILQYALNGTGTFGLGGNETQPLFTDDMDNISVTGFTIVDAVSTANTPPGANFFGLVLTIIGDSGVNDIGAQFWLESANSNLYVRTKEVAWSAWSRMAFASELP